MTNFNMKTHDFLSLFVSGLSVNTLVENLFLFILPNS